MASNSTEVKKKAMYEALVKSLGVVQTAVKKAGITRTTHYRWLEEDPEYKDKVESIVDIEFDFVKSKLHECIQDKNITAIKYLLSTVFKDRGFTEKTELSIIQEQPLFPENGNEDEDDTEELE